MKKYEKYKKVDLPWLDEVPEHWNVCRIKNIISCLTDFTSNGSFGDLAKNVTYLDTKDYARLVRLTDLRVNFANPGVYVNKSSYDYLSKSKLNGYEILIANVGAYTGLFCEMPKLNEKSTLGPNMFLVRTNKTTYEHYLYYLGNSDFVKKQLVQKSISSAQPKINKLDLKTTRIVIPPKSEQEKIAAFLDYKISRIDKAIKLEEKKKEKIKKLKQSIISNAVTKGLNPDLPMKDSGVVRLGKIPKDWDVVKLKYIVKISNGSNPVLLGDIPVYGSGLKSFKTCGEYKNGPTVLLGRKGTVNVPNYIEGRYWNVDTAFDVKVKKNKVELKYFYYNAMFFEYDLYSTQTALPSMTQTDYYSMKIPYPPLKEQQQIVDYLDKKITEIGDYLLKIDEKIEKLKSLKQSLISEVVTGQIDVRDFEIPKEVE